MKKFVQISSEVDIKVVRDYVYKDLSPKASNQGIKVKPLWVGSEVMIKKGVGIYPSEITNWSAVKKLAAIKKITIGEETDEGTAEAEEAKARIAKVEGTIKQELPRKSNSNKQPKQEELELGE